MNLTELSDDDLDNLRVEVLIEQERRQTLATGPAQADDLAKRYAEAVEGQPARDYEPGMVIGPGELVTENGIEYRNTSGAFLSVPPSAYPLGYERTETPDDVAPFKAGETVKPGDLREYQGIVYQCVQGHTTAAHWAPDVAHSLWTRA